MKRMTKVDEILRDAKEQQVQMVRLQFTDILGVMKNVSVPTHQLEKALNNELMFDGSSINGFVRIEESDMYLHPDPDTWCVTPFEPGGTTARLICDIYNADNKPFEGDPRFVLRQAIAQAAAMGYEVNIGPELEFFLFLTDANGASTLKTQDQAGYFDLAPVDLGELARREMVQNLEQMGFEIEASHHECAPGQHEIDFKYNDALATADKVQTFKTVVRQVAVRHGLHATFMPKPVFGVAGSGMHVNQSLFKNGKNAFTDPADPRGLSQEAYWYMGGLLKYVKEFTAITNPTVNSYKRLVSGYEAPVYVAWAGRNRSPLIRVPAKRGSSTRIELRCPDPTCNPYLAFAVMINAGLTGIREQIMPPEPVELNIFQMSEAERNEAQLDILPSSLETAVNLMADSQMVRSWLGDHVYDCYVEAKRREFEEFRIQVTAWEVNKYLDEF